MNCVMRDIADDDIAQVIALWNAAGVARPWNDPARDIAFARSDDHSTVLVGVEAGKVVAAPWSARMVTAAGSITSRSRPSGSAVGSAAS